jgi:hypothetical protein
MTGITIKELQKISLDQDEVLIVRVNSDEVSEESIKALKIMFRQVFPNNEVMVFCGCEVEFTKIKAIQCDESCACTCEDTQCDNCLETSNFFGENGEAE